jgi:integrase
MARHLIAGDATLKSVKPGDARRRISDGEGLYLLLFVNGGSHAWRLDYSIGRRRKTLSLGTYPETGLALARRKAEDARKLISEGVDPSETRKAERTKQSVEIEAERRANEGLPPLGSFEAVAREWHEARREEWSASYGEKIIARLEVDVFPHIGRRPIGAVTPPELLAVLRKIEARGVIETAHRARENCSQIFRFAVATGRAERDAAHDLKDALRRPKVQHFPAITKPARLAEMLRAIDGYAGTHVVRTALQLVPMLMLRPGELRFAEWVEIDLDESTWTIPAHRMKRERAAKRDGPPHFVPLARQAVKLLRELHPLTSAGRWVFRGERHHDRPMSENTVNAALRAMGFPREEVTGHGFRATARTMLAERLDVDEAVIEAQLAHSVRDNLGRAYNRTEFLEQRRAMMQTWADYLDRLTKGADVVSLRDRKS